MSDNTLKSNARSPTRPKYPLGILILKAQSIAAVSPKLNLKDLNRQTQMSSGGAS